MKKWKYCLLISLFCVLLSGCKSESVKEKGNPAEKVIRAMLTCPNDDLYSEKAVVIMGEGAEGATNPEDVKKEQERVAKNWRKEVGEFFAPDALDKFLGQAAFYYLAQSQMTGEEISVKEIEKAEESETAETYEVVILRGNAEENV